MTLARGLNAPRRDNFSDFDPRPKERNGIRRQAQPPDQKAKHAAVDHKDQVEQAVEKAAGVADQRTGGQYHDQLLEAEAKADTYLETQAQHPHPTTRTGPGQEVDEPEPREKPNTP